MATDLQPKVSVLIPVYNGEASLATAIRSILGQTWSNLDLTIVNNRSTDRTREIAERFAASDPRVHIHDNDTFPNVVENASMILTSRSAGRSRPRQCPSRIAAGPACTPHHAWRNEH